MNATAGSRELEDLFDSIARETLCATATPAASGGTKAAGLKLRVIMVAQEYQDLTGQVIKKITQTVRDLEQQLLALLLDNVPPANRQEATGLLSGPVLSAVAGVVSSQTQADDRLKSLGFRGES